MYIRLKTAVLILEKPHAQLIRENKRQYKLSKLLWATFKSLNLKLLYI